MVYKSSQCSRVALQCVYRTVGLACQLRAALRSAMPVVVDVWDRSQRATSASCVTARCRFLSSPQRALMLALKVFFDLQPQDFPLRDQASAFAWPAVLLALGLAVAGRFAERSLGWPQFPAGSTSARAGLLYAGIAGAAYGVITIAQFARDPGHSSARRLRMGACGAALVCAVLHIRHAVSRVHAPPRMPDDPHLGTVCRAAAAQAAEHHFLERQRPGVAI